MPGSCFWPEKEAGIRATPFLTPPAPISLLSVTHSHLGAFCTEKVLFIGRGVLNGVIFWGLGKGVKSGKK